MLARPNTPLCNVKRNSFFPPENIDFLSPFASAAIYLRKLGLAPIPIAPGEKKPLIAGFQRWEYPPAEAAINKFSRKFPDAQIAVLCGLSNIVVVDLDDAALLDCGLERFGETPLIIKTRRGFHLYYKAQGGERGKNLRSQGLNIDIKAGVAFVMVPPSINSEGAPLIFWRGSWRVLDRLPLFKDSLTSVSQSHRSLAVSERQSTPKKAKIEVLSAVSCSSAPSSFLFSPSGSRAGPGGDETTLVLRRSTGQSHASLTPKAENVIPLRKNVEGERNKALFNFLRKRPLTTLEALERDALWYNETYQELPEEPDNALATARSVWRYRIQWQECFSGSLAQLAPGAIVILPEVDDAIAKAAGDHYPQGIATYVRLQRAHAARSLRGEAFNISPSAMAAAETVPGLKRRAIEIARDNLLNAGVLTRIQEFSNAGGRRQSALYQFVKPAPASALAVIAQLPALQVAPPKHQSAPETRPWEQEGVSRATYFRRRRNPTDG